MKDEIKQLPKRSEVPLAMTWDLTKIFKDDQAFEQTYAELEDQLSQAADYEGTLGTNAQTFQSAIHYLLSVHQKIEKVYVYSHLKNDQDKTETTYQSLYARSSTLLTKAREALAWFEPELLTLSNEKIWGYFNENQTLEIYRHFIENILEGRPHVLSSEEEALIAAASEIFSAPSNTFSVLNNADLKFPVIEDEKGEKIQLTHGTYGQLLERSNRKVRKDAFEGLYTIYQQFAHTFAATLSTNVKVHNYKARIRKYQSARQAALKGNNIPESVYETLISVVNKELPLLHRYVSLRKQLLNVEHLHTYDLYTPLLGESMITFTYEEAKEKILAALQPMGEEYLAIIQEAFNSRWIDVMENQGKRSGAYSSGAYDTAPYILMNWHNSMDQMYTLIHELGHSVHSYLTRKHQPYVYGDYSIFLAEIASTTNENLLTEYLLKNETDPYKRAYIINHYLDGFKGTIFRQTQFAEFEHFIHEEDAKGIPLTSEYLCNYYQELNQKYYGDALHADQEIAFEWTRIPHFYYNYYVYQYATGFSAASALANKIWNREPDALANYLTYLKAGSSDYPIEVMKKAGVDMTKPQYIEDAMMIFSTRLNELETLVKQLS